MAKAKSIFVCQNCGHEESKWVGKCSVCGEWNTFVEKEVLRVESKIMSSISHENVEVKSLSSIDLENSERFSTGFYEFDRVLGGGIVDDEVMLISGEPGIGKSTILLQVASVLSKNKDILYVSGEESGKQISLRARRLFESEDEFSKINFLSTGSISIIEKIVHDKKPDIMIVDSIQTAYDETAAGLPGGLAQVRACSSKLIYLAKSLGVILILVGHINKEGKIAGPKVLEHIVDCVLQFEGERNGEFRVLRSIKNRFGSTGEVGIFIMGDKGLQDLKDDNSLFSISDVDNEIGVAKTLVVEGSRPIVIDIQSLVSKTIFAYPKRVSEGVSVSKVQLLSAILEGSKVARLLDSDLYVRTTGGYNVKDYSYADLGVIASMISAKKGIVMGQDLIFVGEVSLNGRVHTPNSFDKHIKEIQRIFPKATIISSQKIGKKSLQVKTIGELLKIIK